ncbi:MAG: serine/threonine-protein kinase, partial [Bryobacterales bacterium]|nr:serine/threonine-protein kinase [Bryobacterales bacterium]
MTEQSADWERITELLALAVEQPPERRLEWLHQTGEAPQRIARVEDLLSAYEDAPHFMEPQFPIPGKLGPWVVRGELGHGGMGRVLEALHEDPSLGRRVAIKVIGEGRAVPGLLEAFLQERAILARLEHPAIARLYDTGCTAEGLPYFAMEYVDGIAYDVWLRESRPTPRESVRLLLSIAGAVAYAHRHFVAHGDLKPGNILITASGEPRLLDFGIARAWNATDSTQLPMLTPTHASPEQLQGKPITAASDLYQLGLLLRMAELETDRELAAIVALCLREAPEERYPSAEALCQDLAAWMERGPVTAMGAHPWYLLRKRIQRHPLAAVLLVGMVLATAGAVWQAYRAESLRDTAVRQSSQTRQFARSLLASIPSLPSTAQKSIVESTVKLLEQTSANQERDPVLQLELAFAWMLLGQVQGLPTARNLGDPESAARSYRQAIGLAEQADAAGSKEALPMLVSLYAGMARVQRSLPQEARTDAYDRKLQALVPRLARQDASDSLAYAYAELAFLATARDRGAAMSLYQQAVETYDNARNPDFSQKAFALKRWGALLLASGDAHGGIERYQKALAIERSIQARPFDISYTLSDLGLAFRRQKRFPEAERCYREAL